MSLLAQRGNVVSCGLAVNVTFVKHTIDGFIYPYKKSNLS